MDYSERIRISYIYEFSISLYLLLIENNTKKFYFVKFKLILDNERINIFINNKSITANNKLILDNKLISFITF